MDWNKTKTILIFAFLCLNILLGYRLWFSGAESFSPWIVPEKKEEVLDYLQAKNISLKSDIPGEVQSKSFYEVRNKGFCEEKFFDDLELNLNEFEKTKNENFNLYMGPKDEVIYIYNSGMIKFYFPRGYTPVDSPIKSNYWHSTDKVFWGKDFVNTISVPDNVFLEQIYFGDENQIELLYHQKNEDENFYGGYLRLIITPNGIIRGQFFWLDFKGKSEDSIEIIPATTALLRLESHLPSGVENVIKEVSFGYYTQEFYADKWDALPAWKFKLQDRIYYINAFTGELEGKIEAFE
ncbi:two-component system regulatory protein YycI [Natranaerofaba carboxydovora]|uniref:two-component system regulatory protein YycI n=1 Tax=Natranaerofaba carboxydovora TaxID=2742683 RepID=UPI001F134A9F|nr:two-component system regulatory protein YycI [Natranaerofaba carboxydovora]UMZ75154.1 YycH protein [Natranaerofaba carboxydovora]